MPENIQVGHKYRETSFPHRMWEVARLLEPIPGMPHAQLRLLADQSSAKLISCLALRTGVSYQRVEAKASGRS